MVSPPAQAYVELDNENDNENDNDTVGAGRIPSGPGLVAAPGSGGGITGTPAADVDRTVLARRLRHSSGREGTLWPAMTCVGLAVAIAAVLIPGDPVLAVAALVWTALIVGIWFRAVVTDRPRRDRPTIHVLDYLSGSFAAAILAGATAVRIRPTLALLHRARTPQARAAVGEGLPRIAEPWPVHRQRISWHEGTAPTQRHACWPQTVAVLAASGLPFERCPCGGQRVQRRFAPWERRNDRPGAVLSRPVADPSRGGSLAPDPQGAHVGPRVLALPVRFSSLLVLRSLTSRPVRMTLSAIILSVPMVCFMASSTAEPVREMIPRIGEKIEDLITGGGGDLPGGGGPSAPDAIMVLEGANAPAAPGSGAGVAGVVGVAPVTTPGAASPASGGVPGQTLEGSRPERPVAAVGPSSSGGGGVSASGAVGAVSSTGSVLPATSGPAAAPTAASTTGAAVGGSQPPAGPTGSPGAGRTSSAGQVLPPGVSSAVSALVGPVAPVVSAASSAVDPDVAPVTSAVAPVLEPVASALDPVVAPVTTAIDAVADPVLSAVTSVASSVLAPVTSTVAAEVVEPVASVVGSAVAPVGEVVGSAASSVAAPVARDVVAPVAESVVAPVAESVVAPVAEEAGNVVAPVASSVGSVSSPAGSAVGAVVGSVVGRKEP